MTDAKEAAPADIKTEVASADGGAPAPTPTAEAEGDAENTDGPKVSRDTKKDTRKTPYAKPQDKDMAEGGDGTNTRVYVG